MPSENQLAQKAADRALSLKNNSCNPSDTIALPSADSQLNSMPVNPPKEGDMYGR